MKVLATILCILLVRSVSGQSENLDQSKFNRVSNDEELFKTFMFADQRLTDIKYSQSRSEFEKLINQLIERRGKFKDKKSYLRFVFKRLHRRVDWYKTNAFFSDIFLKKEYDCLTGSALFAFTLEQLDFEYTIHEFNFHVFLMVHLGSERLLLDVTDPINGFVTDKAEINHRYNMYLTDFGKLAPKDQYNQEIDLKSLAGLQYFNISVEHLNQRQYSEARKNLDRAYALYPSNRIKSMGRLIAISEN